MKRITDFKSIVLLAAILVAACTGGSTKEERERADRLMTTAYHVKDFDRMLVLADSLEQAGSLSAVKANYWRGYACDRKKQLYQAEAYCRKSMEDAASANSREDRDYYVKAASRLANILCIRGDYEATLQMAEPVVAELEAARRDTTSDYENLLVYVNCCRAVLGGSETEIEDGFARAYKKHMENIQKNRNDVSYKNAIAGLINIAYYCVKFKKYKYALSYTRHFGELLAEYEQRDGVSADYVDRQLGRYDIYKAMALKGLGRTEEAGQVFQAYQETRFSTTPEGEALAGDFLAEAD